MQIWWYGCQLNGRGYCVMALVVMGPYVSQGRSLFQHSGMRVEWVGMGVTTCLAMELHVEDREYMSLNIWQLKLAPDGPIDICNVVCSWQPIQSNNEKNKELLNAIYLNGTPSTDTSTPIERKWKTLHYYLLHMAPISHPHSPHTHTHIHTRRYNNNFPWGKYCLGQTFAF